MNIHSLFALTATFVISFGVLTLAYADKAPPGPPPMTAEQSVPTDVDLDKSEREQAKTQSDLEKIKDLKAEIKRLTGEIQKTSDEEQAVLRDQRRTRHAEVRDILKGLVKRVAELEAAGYDARELRQAAAELTAQVSTWLRSEVSDSIKLVVAMDEKLKDTPDSDIPELRQRIATERQAIDEELGALLENTNRMALLGLDNSADLKYLDEILVQRADNLLARLEYLIEQRDGLRKEIGEAGEEEKKRLKEKVSSLDGRISATANNLNVTIDLMDGRKLDTARYKQALILATGEITKDVIETKVALGIIQQWLEDGKAWLLEQGPNWLFKLIVFAFILVVSALAARLVRVIAARALASTRLHASKLLQNLFVSIAGKTVFVIGFLIALTQVGVEIGPVLAGLGIAGFIIGFALQDTLANFVAGVMILIYRPYDVGDAIEVGGISGNVKKMSLVSTTINTFDNQRVIVPNKSIWGGVIRNINAEKIRRIDLVFGIGYDDDVELAEHVLHEIVDNYDLVLADPAPAIQLHTLGESSIDFVVRPWVKTSDYWTAYWHITKAVKKRFDEEGISIPFPQQDMHVYHHGETARGLEPAATN